MGKEKKQKNFTKADFLLKGKGKLEEKRTGDDRKII